MSAQVSRITLYPVKSLDGVDVRRSEITAGGSLKNDRRFAMKSPDGKYINGKRNPLIYKLRALYGSDLSTVQFSVRACGESPVFDLDTKNEKLINWLSDYFSVKVQIVENSELGNPDDKEAYGPTIISAASLEAVGSWFRISDIAQLQRRFRANILLSNCEPFWEDNLFSVKGDTKKFNIGNVIFMGTNPCARCIVPSTDPDTGEVIPEFQKIFAEKRKEYLPHYAEPSQFDHYYRLAVNTIIPRSEKGKYLNAGDQIMLKFY